MVWGYEFVNLNDDQKHARRRLLELYPAVAEWSVLVVIALFQLSFLLSWLLKYALEDERPGSPSFSKRVSGSAAWLKNARQHWARLRWWARKPVMRNWGSRGEWIFGSLWAVWLLYLCVVDTGNDYLHLTKRFGIIGASQLPFQYLLAMRAPYSPVQFLTRMSHEELKKSHEILGRIIYFLFILHGIFYMNFFVQSGFLAKRIKDKDVIFGIISLTLFIVVNTTAMENVRRWNYRVFYVSHILIANLIIVPLYLHVTHIRPYVLQVIVVNTLHAAFRFQRLTHYAGTVKLLPGTNLVEIRIPLNAGEAALKWKPGQHVYLSLPSGKAYSTSAKDQFVLRHQANPFTVASVPSQDRELLLVARAINGNTKQLAKLAHSLSPGTDEAPNIPLALEGPYGASTRLPDFSTFDRILLVAGGVGATFIMPIYRSILDSTDHTLGTQVRFIWAVRKLSEAQWASLPSHEDEDADDSEAVSSSHRSVVEVCITRPSGPNLQMGGPGDDIEMAEDEQLLSLEEQMGKPRKGMAVKEGRPRVSKIVDEVCSKGTRIAVLVCGPQSLTEELSRTVESWVQKGSDIYWHEETFGW
ncbi:hypothetical protein P154DRAFT_553449 [Amniculicola lignicola CBS 123094]|uniref:ferric-chelate reductase (NADPH) n=1 Tax=Amniculicola lignicola CBS 123094 TaxID=1392246 RepID=A0A6A5WJS3_9PLEO|nr:hypothetical protein P154DRAFT_553449 [Amniculicola lignicola CBS 123094]